jgi:hypothetical protein
MIMSKKQYEKQIEVTDEKYKILELVVDKVNREDSDVIN